MGDYKIIAVDFDGTLCEDNYPAIGKANVRLIQRLIEYQRIGNKLILWTCRSGKELEQAVDWCRAYGLFFNKVNENTDENVAQYGMDTRKVYADIYIDDRSYRPYEFELECSRVG